MSLNGPTVAELKIKADKLKINYKAKVLKSDLEKMIKKAEDDKKKQKKKESKARCAAVNKKTKTEASKNYEIKQQLGLRGRDGKTFLVLDKFGYEYAMKQFRSNKSIESILEEVFFQRKCSDIGLCPKIIDVDTKNKYIVMEKMDCHLLDEINSNGGILTEKRQKELIHILNILDKIKVFHGDANILNYMIKNDRLYVIDFGLTKAIDEKLIEKVKTKTPNLKLMLTAFIFKLKEANVHPQSFTFLKPLLSDTELKQFGL